MSISLLKQFLEKTKQSIVNLQQPQQQHPNQHQYPRRIHIVLGNEAADADSLISTLCYAFLKQHTQHTSGKKKRNGDGNEDGEEEEGVLFIPVAGVPRDELPLRRDVQLAVRVHLCNMVLYHCHYCHTAILYVIVMLFCCSAGLFSYGSTLILLTNILTLSHQ